MKTFLVIGAGQFGTYLCEKLNDLGHEVMAVDKSEEKLKSVLPFAVSALIGDGTDMEFLRSLGVNNFDVCFVTVGDRFQDSLEITSLLKDCGARYVVSRASRAIQKKFLLRNGADEVVYPEHALAMWSAIRYSADNILDYIELPGANSIFEFRVPEAWVGKTIGELDIRRRYHVNIIGIKKNGELEVVVSPDTILSGETSIMVIGRDKDIEKCFHI